MRLFRKKSDSPGQEYLDGLITSIRKARPEDDEEEKAKPGLHSFVEDDRFPVADAPGPPRVPPGVAKARVLPGDQDQETDEIANLEAYLTELNAAEAATLDDESAEDSTNP
jgi:hypothetical protein